MTQDSIELEARETWPALWCGWRRKCPNCGSGPMLRGYLKVRDTCPVCREELHHHRADDGPAYLPILFVGHLMAPLLLFVFETWRPEPLTLFTIFAVGCVGLTRYLLPRLNAVGGICPYSMLSVGSAVRCLWECAPPLFIPPLLTRRNLQYPPPPQLH